MTQRMTPPIPPHMNVSTASLADDTLHTHSPEDNTGQKVGRSHSTDIDRRALERAENEGMTRSPAADRP